MSFVPTLNSRLLEGQVAIVTGAAQGIGRAAAETLAANGALVCLADVDQGLLEEAEKAIGGSTTSFAGDLVDPTIPEKLVAHAIAKFGRLDIIVNAAGYFWDAALHKMSDEQFQAMLDIHAIAPFRICRAAAPYMRLDDHGDDRKAQYRKVVNVSAIAASFGLAGAANYAVGKGALNALTKSLAIEWGRFRVNVNAVAFGPVQTRFGAPRSANFTVKSGGREIPLGISDKVRAKRGASTEFDPSKLFESRLSEATLLGRTGTVVEAADAIFWLASPLSNYVTGQVITVSGGLPGGLC